MDNEKYERAQKTGQAKDKNCSRKSPNQRAEDSKERTCIIAPIPGKISVDSALERTSNDAQEWLNVRASILNRLLSSVVKAKVPKHSLGDFCVSKTREI